MTRKHLILGLLAGSLALTACSDGEDFSDLFLAEAKNNYANLNYSGFWTFTNGNETLRSQVSTTVSFAHDTQTLTLWSMPNDLIRQIAGWEGTATDYAQYDWACQTTLQAKGNSNTTWVYALNLRDYIFPFMQEDKKHMMKVVFGSASEMAYDTYAQIITLMLSIKEIYLDDQLVANNSGTLVLEATSPTKSQEEQQ